MNIRRAIAADVPHILDLDRACPSAAHWTRQQYEQALRSGGAVDRLCLVAESIPSPADTASVNPHTVAGFLVARKIDRDWELENIGVAPQSRRSGLGKRLLEILFAEIRATNGAYVFLEVRESNTPARKLYEKMGFQQTGRRRSYYSNPQEDAVLYQWTCRDEGGG